MTSRGEQSARRSAPLNRERILDTAMRIVDREGLPALSMRRLGSELGVDPMAIYHHLPNKQAIIAGLVQRVFEEIAREAAADEGANWRGRVRRWGLTYHRIAREHANLIVFLVTNAGAATVSVMRANDILYDALSGSGLPAPDVVRAADTIVDYIHGVVLGGTTPVESGENWRHTIRDHIDAAPPDNLPALRRVFGELDDGEPALDVAFGLDVIIAGLAHRAGTS